MIRRKSLRHSMTEDSMIDVNDYEMKQFDDASLEATRINWLSTAEDLALPSLTYEKTLAWAASHMNYVEKKNDGYAYGIFAVGSNQAVAVVDIVYSTRVRDVGLIKMLEVTMGPDLAPSVITAESYSQLISIYGQAITGTIALTAAHPARIVKLYGRDDDLMKLFAALNHTFNSIPTSPIKSKIESRWLVVT